MNDRRFDRVLVIAPHSDDAELGVGGLLARLSQNGSKVRICIMAVGETVRHISPTNTQHITAETRKHESYEALKVLGVSKDDIFIFSKMDGCLDRVPMKKAVRFLDEMIDEFQPTAIFMPLPSYHQDHRYTFDAGFAAVRPNPAMANVDLVGCYEYPMNALDYQIPYNSRIYLDISGSKRDPRCEWCVDGAPDGRCTCRSYLNLKIDAYLKHASQQERETFHPLHPESIRDLAAVRGRECGVKYAERYYLVREVLKLE